MTGTERAGGRKVFLHVGSPKTGTTFLQNVLWAGRDTARRQGLLLPMDRFADHYLATLDVRGLAERPEHPDRALGMWQRIVEQVEAWPGDALVSHELFAAATRQQADAAVHSFGPDTEVHVVLTARDLLRQLPAEWQEHVKHRSTLTLDAFAGQVMADDRGRSWFWRVQDYSRILRRWGRSLPPEHLHVVTVPPRGADPTALWTRFAALLGLDPDTFRLDVGRSNLSLGMEQAELLRRVNEELDDRLALPGPYPRVVKEMFAQQVLAGRKGSPLQLDERTTAFAVARSRRLADDLATMGVDVVGDLEELVPRVETPTSPGAAGFLHPSEEVLLTESVAALAGVLARFADSSPAERDYRRQVELMRRMPVRYALAQASHRHPALGRLRRAYQRGRARLNGGWGSSASGRG
ncbi:MAG TPA: hypothetical protein VFM09_14345 [Marmoricola sp.]|nr:hypothetical protein [Marmoricola sp.]